jgi:hypothetical protein
MSYVFYVFYFVSPFAIYISSLCRTVPGYIGSIYAVFGFIINVLFIKIELFGVHLNPYKSLLFHSSKIRNILCWDECSEGEYKINERPAYTDICKFKEDRSTLCKFRISAHCLNIEKGGYYNIPRENRVCLSCKAGKVEDFFEKIKSILGEVNQKVFNKRQMIALLNSNSPKLLNIIVNFMNKCMSKRNSS